MLFFKRVNKTWLLLPVIFWFVSGASIGFAQLKIESVNPTLGVLGQELEVTLKGTGFDANTRVSFALDPGAQRHIIKTLEDITGSNLIIKGSTGYVNNMHDLEIYNFTDPINPHLLSRVRVSNSLSQQKGLAVSGTKAYLPYYDSGNYGIRVVDISNPATPQIIGSVAVLENMPFGYDISDLAVWGDMVYAATGYGGLHIIDVSVPGNPQVVKSVEIQTSRWAEGVTATENTVYVAGGYGFWIIDVSDPATASITGSVLFNWRASYRVRISENKAYLATTDGLKVIDISNPSNPYEIGSLDSSWSYDIFLKNDIAYLIDKAGLQIINISVPNNPELIGTIFTQGYSVAVTDEMGYVLGNEDLKVINVSNPVLSVITGAVDTPGWANQIAVVGEMVYVADRYYLQVITVADPYNPEILGSVNIGDMAEDIIVEGNTVFLANSSNGNTELDIGLDIINVSNPANPQKIGWVDTPGGGPISTAGGANGIFYSQNTIYMADGYSGLQIIDVSDLENPVIIGAVDTPGMALAVAVEAGYAYVADAIEGLQIINIGNPANPIITTSVKGWYVRDVAVKGDTLYATTSKGLKTYNISSPGNPLPLGTLEGTFSDINITGTLAYANGNRKIHVVDIAVPSDTRLIASVDLPGSGGGFEVLDDLAYVAMGQTGVLIVPVPVEIMPVSVYSSTSISFTAPSPLLAGHYTLRVFNAVESDELFGAVSFVQSDEYEIQQQKKAIIVAGGGDYPENELWDPTYLISNYAYLSLKSQGYTRENIYYLGDDTQVDVDGDGIYNDVDMKATYNNLLSAIDWAKDAGDLIFFLADHGGLGTFQLNAVPEIIKAEKIDEWLDNLQADIPGRLVFIYDACMSGSFLPLLSPPPGKDRIVITSSQAGERAWFEKGGVLSFSYQFWASVFIKGNLYRSFLDAKKMAGDNQTPMIDADGDGLSFQKNDKKLARNILIGRGRSAGSTPPIIGGVTIDQNLLDDNSAEIRVKIIAALNPISEVLAIIKPPDEDLIAVDKPVVDLPKIELFDPDLDGTYMGNYSGFTKPGTYKITVFAVDTEDYYSLPSTKTLTKTDGPDIYEDDDTYQEAKVIVLNDQNPENTLAGYEKIQDHTIHDEGDDDWVVFHGIKGETYKIRVLSPGDNMDAVIGVYKSDGQTLAIPEEVDDTFAGQSEYVEWEATETGIYYVRIRNYDTDVYGAGIEYQLTLTQPYAAFGGFITGTVTPIISGIITTGYGSAIILPNGSYFMPHIAGTFTLTVNATGYQPSSQPVTVGEIAVVRANISLTSSEPELPKAMPWIPLLLLND